MQPFWEIRLWHHGVWRACPWRPLLSDPCVTQYFLREAREDTLQRLVRTSLSSELVQLSFSVLLNV